MKFYQSLSVQTFFQEKSSVLVFIDSKLQDYQSLINGIKSGAKAYILHSEVDGVKQITQTLSKYHHVESIHIISHGIPGTLYLGNTELSLDTLGHYNKELQTWFNSTSTNNHTPTLILYGCNVAADAGTELLEKLHQLTNANIYASSTVVGNLNLGGNWDLDVRYGKDTSAFPGLVFQPEVLATYAGVFGTGTDLPKYYTYYDSKEVAKGTVAFTDISATGDFHRIATDQQSSAIDLPFTFNFYGTNFSKVVIGENGGIAFVDNGTAQFRANNADIPSTSSAVPINSIFPFWDDLDAQIVVNNRTGKIYSKLESDRFTIQWTNFQFKDSLNNVKNITFQVVLYKESNNIDFIYSTATPNDGGTASIGINKGSVEDGKAVGIAYSVNTSNLNGVTSIRFITEPQLKTNALSVKEGETIILSSSNFNATDVDNSIDLSKVTYTISNLLNGEFRVNSNVAATFTQKDINDGKVQFIHNGSENAPSFNITLSDGYNTSSLKLASINFTNLNDNPVLTDTTPSANFTENALNATASMIPSNIMLTDVDSSDFNGGNLTVNYSSASGTEDQLSIISGSSGITLSSGNVSYNGTVFGSIDTTNNGTNGKSLVIGFTNASASLPAVTALIENLSYQNTSNTPNASRTISITVNDGDGGTSTAVSKVINVNAENDAPVNTVPGMQNINEDDVLTFTTANLISVSDPDAGNNPIKVRLEANKGTLSLNGISGLNFANGGVGDGTDDTTLEFTAAITDINKALNGIVYRGNKNYNGKDTLTITTNDLNNTGGVSQADIDTVEITLTPVNDPPVNADVPVAQSVNEDTSLIFNTKNQNAIRISDVDVDDEQNGLVGDVKVTLAVTRGKVTLAQTTGLTFIEGSTNSSAIVIVTGSVENINKAIDGLAYLGNEHFNGEDTLTISINDKSNGGSGELYQKDTVKINVKPVNDTHVNTVPSKQSVKEDTDLAFNAANSNSLSISDPDANEGIGETEVKLSVTKGMLTLQETAGLTFKEGDGKGNTAISFTGKLADINKALASLTYRGNANFHGQDTLTITTNDKGLSVDDGATDTDTVDITVTTVNDAPVNNVPLDQKVDENKQLIFSDQKGNAISVSDVDASEGTGEVEVTLAVSKGVLTLEQVAGITFKAGDGKANATMTFAGKVGDINKALEGIVYKGNINYIGQDILTITTSELGNFGSDILIDTDTIGISVIPDTDDDGISNFIEEEVVSEIAKQNPTDINFKSLSQKVADDAAIVALFGQDGIKKPIVIVINEQDQKQLGGTSQTSALVVRSVTTQRFNDAIPDPIAAFDSKDLKKSSLKKLMPVLDVINFEVMPNPVINEEGLQQKIKEGIKQKPVKIEFKLPDGLDDAPINTILNRKSDGTLYDFRRLFNPNRGELDDDTLTGAVLQDRNLDGKADWAVVYLQDANWGDEDGVVNAQIKHSLVAANWDFGTTRMEVRSSNDGLNFYGNRSYVQFTLDRFSGVEASEVGMARVRFDSDGQIVEVNGKAVKSTEEAKQAIIGRGETLFSSLSKKNRNPDIGTQTRTVAFEEGEQAVFFVIQGTKDELLFKGLNSNSVQFSLPTLNNGTAIMTASNDELGQTAKLSLAGLFDVSAKVLTTEEARPQLGLLAVGQSQAQLNTTDELIDLKSSAAFDGKQVKLNFSLQREAENNNSAYLYRVDDAKGSIRDSLTGMLLDPTSSLSVEQKQRYLELLTTDRLVQGTEMQTSNLQTKEISVNLTGGEYYLPFLVSDGTLSSINKDFSRILTPYLGINSDGADHIRSLGNGKFGFEDLIGGGDRDYNDMILSIRQVQIIS